MCVERERARVECRIECCFLLQIKSQIKSQEYKNNQRRKILTNGYNLIHGNDLYSYFGIKTPTLKAFLFPPPPYKKKMKYNFRVGQSVVFVATSAGGLVLLLLLFRG